MSSNRSRSTPKPVATPAEFADIDFAASGFYSTDELHPRAIKVGDVEGLVYVRKLPVTDLRRFQIETASENENVRATAGLTALVKAIRREDGSAHMTFAQAQKLTAPAVKELLRVFVEVNTDAEGDAGNA